MINALGFLGLILNLISMTMKDIFLLRFLSLAANTIYFVYGFSPLATSHLPLATRHSPPCHKMGNIFQ